MEILEALRELELTLQRSKPILQAIAIYDCMKTQDSCIILEYDTDLLAVASTFGIEAGPVVRWFWRSLSGPDLKLEVVPINKYGQAVILSQKAFDSVPLVNAQDHLLGPTVYNLNGDKRL